MKKDPFNPKHFRGNARIERTVATNIVREWAWNARLGQYVPGAFLARRWEPRPEGGKQRVRQAFATLEDARRWQAHLPVEEQGLASNVSSAVDSPESSDLGPTLAEVLVEFRRRHYPKLARGSVVNYEQQFGLHFGRLTPLRVHEITPTVIDDWLDALKDERERSYRPTLRLSFEKELSLLATVLRFYDEYWDDKAFKLPIKKRHRENAQVVRRAGKKERGLSYADFLRVRDAILDSKYGEAIYVLMTLQFRQALRIGEAAALHWEDVTMDFKDPSNSSIRIRRHLDWARKRDCTSHIADGLKNSAAVGLSKESPMFPETFEALKRIFVVGGKGLVFKNDRGTFFEYRSLQHAYMLAFKRAGIEYGGTHNFRHGGCQLVYDRTGGDQALAGQLLGNEDSETVRVYARRSKTALKEAAQREWAAL